MEKKIAKQKKENIVYLNENDARAIGIVEGYNQSILVDGRQVELTFIDEHDIFDATSEEKRILNNSLNLREKELINKNQGKNSLTTSNFRKENNESVNIKQQSKSGTSIFDSLKTFFGRRHRGNNAGPNTNSINRYQNRTDIFTNEEIEIIQEVIAQTHSRKPVVNKTATTVKRKSSNTKKKTAKKPKPKAKK